ncbi:hypothetical protein WJX74_000978 [Apatococcus lobatus]|uniref:Glutathione S-transferase n=1 Tax=Apatococcus lobatus TaxID=904363 RepID=A0AAW1RX43_9CHLO
MALLVTALYGSVLGLLFASLSLFVGLSRAGSGVHHGASKNGKEDTLFASRIRAQQNFAEYVPIALILLALLEFNGATSSTLHGLGIALVLFRVFHATKLWFPNEAPILLRMIGFLGTIAWIGFASTVNLLKAIAA